MACRRRTRLSRTPVRDRKSCAVITSWPRRSLLCSPAHRSIRPHWSSRARGSCCELWRDDPRHAAASPRHVIADLRPRGVLHPGQIHRLKGSGCTSRAGVLWISRDGSKPGEHHGPWAPTNAAGRFGRGLRLAWYYAITPRFPWRRRRPIMQRFVDALPYCLASAPASLAGLARLAHSCRPSDRCASATPGGQFTRATPSAPGRAKIRVANKCGSPPSPCGYQHRPERYTSWTWSPTLNPSGRAAPRATPAAARDVTKPWPHPLPAARRMKAHDRARRANHSGTARRARRRRRPRSAAHARVLQQPATPPYKV